MLWPNRYNGNCLTSMERINLLLHIKMAALKTIGDWLRGSGWAQALVQTEIATAGTADSFYRASHVMCTRRAHQITVSALHILKHRAYDHYNTAQTENGHIPADFEAWLNERKDNCPQFHYW